MKANNVFIIGNGFDISLEWKTKYSDFAKEKDYWPFSNNDMIGLANHLQQSRNKEKWLDIEHELYEYAKPDNKEWITIFSNPEKDKECFNCLKGTLFKYLSNVQYSSPIKKDSPAAKILSAIVKNGSFKNIFSFNYTDLSKIAKELGLRDITVNHVHGSLKNNDIILGINDNKEIKRNYDFLYKTFDKNYSGTSIQYAMREAKEVVIFGHSMGDVDFHYFKDFFSEQMRQNISLQDRKRITIFTFNESSRTEILQHLQEISSDHSLSRLYSNNDFHIILTNGKEEKEIEDFCNRLTYKSKKDAIKTFLHDMYNALIKHG